MSDYNDGLLPTPCLRMDTHFGDEYESIEFGDGTGYIKAAPILAKVGALHEEIDRVRDENVKLLELLADLYQCSRQVGCDHCGDGYRRSCNVLNRMRELGVEVDE